MSLLVSSPMALRCGITPSPPISFLVSTITTFCSSRRVASHKGQRTKDKGRVRDRYRHNTGWDYEEERNMTTKSDQVGQRMASEAQRSHPTPPHLRVRELPTPRHFSVSFHFFPAAHVKCSPDPIQSNDSSMRKEESWGSDGSKVGLDNRQNLGAGTSIDRSVVLPRFSWRLGTLHRLLQELSHLNGREFPAHVSHEARLPGPGRPHH